MFTVWLLTVWEIDHIQYPCQSNMRQEQQKSTGVWESLFFLSHGLHAWQQIHSSGQRSHYVASLSRGGNSITTATRPASCSPPRRLHPERPPLCRAEDGAKSREPPSWAHQEPQSETRVYSRDKGREHHLFCQSLSFHCSTLTHREREPHL